MSPLLATALASTLIAIEQARGNQGMVEVARLHIEKLEQMA
ncbi:MAG: hypothetical protein SFW36_15325 [Leptolyngbyaceae cyanobacterium bins.59]|nr:hypothetical protein [Leptolyngbyaceae cyanobacterium bins.59]